MLAIYKKEMFTYFTSMTGYIFLGFLVFLTALYFVIINLFNSTPDFYYVLASVSQIFLIIIPMLTMRLFSEEKRQKTDQLLYTSPVNVWQIVFGKFFAATSVLVLGMLITCIFPLMLLPFGPIPVPQIIGSYIGFTLLGICFISVGLFISTLTDNQVVAAVSTFVVLFLFYVMDGLANLMPKTQVASIVFIIILVCILVYYIYTSTKNFYACLGVFIVACALVLGAYIIDQSIFDGFIYNFFMWFSLMSRFNNFYSGILNLSDLVYYISFSFVFVYLAINTIERKRWI